VSVWYRVFSLSAEAVPPSAVAGHLHAAGVAAEPHFRGDDLGWTGGELRLPGGAVVALERYLTAEDELRPELNAFAADLEAADAAELMRHVIQTQQLVTMDVPDGLPGMDGVCRLLAAGTDGVYQVEGRGWFAADGTLLLASE
jgi:hypothetical protein